MLSPTFYIRLIEVISLLTNVNFVDKRASYHPHIIFYVLFNKNDSEFCTDYYLSFREKRSELATSKLIVYPWPAKHNYSAIYANSLDLDETPSNSASHPDPFCLITFSLTLIDIEAL